MLFMDEHQLTDKMLIIGLLFFQVCSDQPIHKKSKKSTLNSMVPNQCERALVFILFIMRPVKKKKALFLACKPTKHPVEICTAGTMQAQKRASRNLLKSIKIR